MGTEFDRFQGSASCANGPNDAHITFKNHYVKTPGSNILLSVYAKNTLPQFEKTLQ